MCAPPERAREDPSEEGGHGMIAHMLTSFRCMRTPNHRQAQLNMYLATRTGVHTEHTYHVEKGAVPVEQVGGAATPTIERH